MWFIRAPPRPLHLSAQKCLGVTVNPQRQEPTPLLSSGARSSQVREEKRGKSSLIANNISHGQTCGLSHSHSPLWGLPAAAWPGTSLCLTRPFLRPKSRATCLTPRCLADAIGSLAGASAVTEGGGRAGQASKSDVGLDSGVRWQASRAPRRWARRRTVMRSARVGSTGYVREGSPGRPVTPHEHSDESRSPCSAICSSSSRSCPPLRSGEPSTRESEHEGRSRGERHDGALRWPS